MLDHPEPENVKEVVSITVSCLLKTENVPGVDGEGRLSGESRYRLRRTRKESMVE